jgi:uncharacterized protein (DUF1697 family)
MAALREVLATEGFGPVETLLASGNALIDTPWDDPETEAKVEAAIQVWFGFQTDVLVRDAAQFRDVMAANPFHHLAAERPNLLIVMFLRGAPKAGLELLEPLCVAGERAAAGAGCLFLAYPSGSGTSKLTGAAIERRLGVRGTGRNWNTVGKLLARLSQEG